MDSSSVFSAVYLAFDCFINYLGVDMSRIKEAIGYECAWPETDPQGMAEQQIEQDKQEAVGANPPPLTEEDLAVIPF